MEKFSQQDMNPSGYKYKNKYTNPFFSYDENINPPITDSIYPTPGEVGMVLTVKSNYLPENPTKEDLEWKYQTSEVIDSEARSTASEALNLAENAMIIPNDNDALNCLYNNVNGIEGHYYALKYTNSKFFIEDITEKLEARL